MIRLIFLLPLCLALTAPALASDDSLTEITVTATRRAASQQDVSLAVDAIGQQQITTGAVLTDALAKLPGVDLQQTTPGQGAAIVRGLKGSAILHLVDGMRLNNAIFRTAPTPWFALVPKTSVDRLEVARGTPSSVYGSDAVGGVVNAISRLPEFDSDTLSYFGDFNIAFDTASLKRDVSATLDFGDRNLAASLSAEYLRTGNRQVGGGERISNSGFDARAARFVVRGLPDDRRSWLVDLHYAEQPSTPRVDELVAGFGQTLPSSSEFVFAPNRRIFARTQYAVTTADNELDWSIDMAWQRIDDDRTSRDFGAIERRFEKNRSDLAGISIGVSGDRDLFDWAVGVDIYHDRVSSSRREQSLDTNDVSLLASRFPDGATVTQAGLFAQTQWPLSERHRLSVGARYSQVQIDLPDGTTIDPARVSADIGWITDISDAAQFVANIGSGFRAPNIADLGTLGNRPGNRFNIPNTALGSEIVLHADLGFRYTTSRWRGELMLFGLDYSDQIVSVSTGDVTPEGRDVVQSVNAAESEIVGVEAAFTWFLSDRLDLEIATNYVRGEQRVGAAIEPADRVPPVNGRLQLTYEHSDPLSFSFWMHAAGEQSRLSARDVRDVRIDPEGTPGWAVIGTSVSWRANRDWLLRVGIDNVLDRRYRSHGSGIDAVGRNFMLQFQYQIGD